MRAHNSQLILASPPPNLGIKKFTFSNSSKTIPKQHSSTQFIQIIQNKKIIQSMIKKELTKIQMLDTSVSDQQIQQFVIPQDRSQKHTSTNSYADAQNKVQVSVESKPKNHNKTKRSVVDQKQIGIEMYLEKSVDQKYEKLLKKLKKQNDYRTFFKCLKKFKTSKTNNKAAKYFIYENLTRKYFNMLKVSAEEDIRNVAINRHKMQQCEQMMLHKNLTIFVKSIKNSTIKQKVQKLELMRNRRLKKQNLLSTLQSFQTHNKIQCSKKQLITEIKKTVILKIIKNYGSGLSIQNKISAFQKNKKMKLHLSFFSSLKMNKKNSNKNIEQLVQQYSSKAKIGIKNDVEFINFCKAKKLSDHASNNIEFKLNHIQLSNLFKQSNKLKNQNQYKQFLKLLQQNCKIHRFLKNSIKKNDGKIKKQLISAMQTNYIFRKQINIIKMNHLRYYYNNISQNSIEDIKYTNSLKNCIATSKTWLINNKHIFKADPTNTLQQPIQSKQEQKQLSPTKLVVNTLNHPITQLTYTQLLQKQSKFRKIFPKHSKLMFISNLQQLCKIKKQNKMAVYAMGELSKQRMLKKVWNILRNKQMIKKIAIEINQQIEAELNESQSMKVKQIQEKLIKMKMGKIFKMLSIQKKITNNGNQIKSIHKIIRYKQLIRKLKETKNINKQNKEFNIKIKKLQYLIKYLNLRKLKIQLVKEKSMKQKLQQMKKNKVIKFVNNNKNKNNQIKEFGQQQLYIQGIQLIQHQPKLQFLKLLQINAKINQKSVKVTKNYLKVAFLRIAINIKSKQFQKNVKSKTLKLVQQRQHKIKLNAIMRYRQCLTFIKYIQNNTTLVKSKIYQYKCNFFVKKLFNYSINKQMQKKLKQKAKVLQQQLAKLRKYNFFTKCKQNVKNQNKKLENQGVNNVQNVQQKSSKKELEKQKTPSNKVIIENKKIQGEQKNQQNNDLHMLQQYLEISPVKSKSSNKAFEKKEQIKELLIPDKEKSPKENKVKKQDYGNHLTAKKQAFLDYNQSSEENSFENQKELSYEQYRKSKLQIQENMYQQQENQLQANDQLETKRKPITQLNVIPLSQNCSDQKLKDKSNVSQDISEMDSFNSEYFINKYNDNLIKNAFQFWKHEVIEKKEENKKSIQISYDSVKKAFEGLKMHYKHRKLVKMYIKEYEQQVHYYPHSLEQYNQFKEISQQI